MITRCSSCQGKKTIIGLGAMIKDCPKCDGVGHIKVVLDHDKVAEQVAIVENNEPIKRRGRPKNDRKEERGSTD